ncbi:uncharacterized protein LOC131634500 [Vicia villosa]|uniref:uncharacterized protein LOC131634500 n=1 Tax=Vicia villosa TaxID=3911 RepID=UPI00273A7696|nr:uncharacterized protein LOC131634500 [Vicia villosa]
MDGMLSAKFNLVSNNERLEEANMKAAKWKKYYDQALKDKREAEEVLESLVPELEDKTREQEGQIKGLAFDLQESRNSEQGEWLRRMAIEELLLSRTTEYERALQALTALRETFMCQRDLVDEVWAEREHWKKQYTIISTANEHVSIVPELLKDYLKYQEKYEKMVFLCNNLIQDIPKSLERAVFTIFLKSLRKFSTTSGRGIS